MMKLRLKPLAYIAILSTLAGCTTVIPEILRKIELPPEELIPEIFRTYNLSPEELKVQKNRCEFHRDNRACNIVGLHYGYYYITQLLHLDFISKMLVTTRFKSVFAL